MKFDTPATTNPIDQLKVVGKPTDRIDGPLKTTGTAPYAYERHDVVRQRGVWLRRRRGDRQGPHRVDGSDARQGRARRARNRHGARTPASSSKGELNTAKLLGGPEIQHYHQAIALVVAETFEQARAAAQLVRVEYARGEGAFDLAAAKDTAVKPKDVAAARRHSASAISTARSRPRRCNSTRPTPRPTSRTR